MVTSVTDTTSTGNVQSATSASSIGGSSSADLQNSFLTLLVAQLKNQDPTNPMDNNQLVSQLAQLNTVSGIEKLNTTLGSISGQINSNQSVQATTLIGHGVMIPGKSILVGQGTSTPFGVELGSAAENVTVTITDGSGKVVRSMELGQLTAGVHSYSWDGKNDDGTTAADGSYTMAVSATSGGVQQVVQPLQYGLVNGVVNTTDGAVLDLGLRGQSTLNDVRQIL
ncbi:flagellar hook assembly protein FlgD [Pectobacteriaceae bacterium CE90]|nr:flagellar hook assembly protein FlgD [Prodigiosinella sp. LS101]WJV52179.1 flagellar hook assembly protein FlgD [Prodigiosinella sp. LS101]WJV56536.1 flagellar hook assembly protein FlgD [Pectobacteriaceae bacterium C111]WJY16637.1 flagellar hook assembly protein FlgD [Pectobacteriaceae bacterium CE90]